MDADLNYNSRYYKEEVIRAELRFKNASFMNALKNSNYKSIMEFSRESGLSYHKLISYANLKHLFDKSIDARHQMVLLLESDEWTLFEQYREVVEKAKDLNNKMVTDIPMQKFISLSSKKLLQLQEPKSIERDMIYSESLKTDINKLLKTLKPREASMVRMYFGIGRESSLTMGEIAQEFDLTKERVRQIIEKSIRRLKHRKRNDFLRTYLNGS